jgi:hypothetical protein
MFPFISFALCSLNPGQQSILRWKMDEIIWLAGTFPEPFQLVLNKKSSSFENYIQLLFLNQDS